MKRTIENINRILAKWDPIGVGEVISTDEYQGYIPLILKASENKHKLRICLENILINKLGVGYDSKNKEHSDDLEKICDKIIQVVKNPE